MNKHLSKYLTHENPNLRKWVKPRINRTDQVYEVIESDVYYIPGENQFVTGDVFIPDQNLISLNVKVIYCERLYCERLYCENSQLTQLPDLPVCEILICENSQLTQLPNLPACRALYCSHNLLTELPDLPVCEDLECGNNRLKSLPDLPVCEYLYCKNNPGYPEMVPERLRR